MNNINYNPNIYFAPQVNQPDKKSEKRPVQPQSTNLNQQISTTNPYRVLDNKTNTSLVVTNRLKNQDFEKMYLLVYQSCDEKTQAHLRSLKNKKILLNNKSEDNTTVLENLYKIATTRRVNGLSNEVILKETIKALDNPYSIQQKFGNIPRNIEKKILKNPSNHKVKSQSPDAVNNEITRRGINPRSSCCVAASIEFNLASKHPSEFVRMVNDLSSEKMSTTKTIDLSSLSYEKVEAIKTLTDFKADFSVDESLEKATITLKPDKNAFLRAYVQCIDKDPDERSAVDVLLQSTFMNLGTQGTYNTLTDKNDSEFSYDKVGLTAIEKNFVEQVVENQNKINLTYQILDDSAKLVDRSCSLQEIENHILKTLSLGSNVIIGITTLNFKDQVINGHEVTIVGARKDPKTNETIFIINDTDDLYTKPVEKKASEILPNIHHAGDLMQALGDEVQMISNSDYMLDFFNEYLMS